MEQEEKIIQMRWMELVVAAFFAIIGAIVIIDSLRTGYRWAPEGPEPGYFPFYIGVVLVLGSAYVAFETVMAWRKDGGKVSFASHEEFGLVLKMLLPTVAYVVVLIFAGLYAASILFIAGFMVWQGKYSYLKSILMAVTVSFVIMVFFEVIFQVSLPKNPLDDMLVSQLIQVYAAIKGMF